MSELLHHRFAADLEIRAGNENGGRTVMGLCCPFDAPTPINEYGISYTEVFARGAFERTIALQADKVKFLAQHDRSAFPLGRATLLREDASGLYGEFYVSKTERGDEALELIRDGALDGFSVGFAPVRSTPNIPRNGDLVSRQEVRLSEVSAVSFPAYDSARIIGVRSEQDYADALEALEALRKEHPEGLDESRLDAAIGWLIMARAGKTLSDASMGTLQGVLDHVAAAHSHNAAAAPALATLMGVPDPTQVSDGDAGDEDDGSDDGGQPDGRAASEEQETREEPVVALDYDLAVRIARRHRIAV